MNYSISIYLKATLLSILSITAFLGMAFAQAPGQVIPKTGVKPTAGSDVIAPDEAKKPESEKEASNGESEEVVGLSNDETDAKRAKPVNYESIRVFGWVEWCVIGDEKLRMKARLDTGAKTSSLHAEDVELFERDGAKWVKFTTVSNDEKRVMIERPLVRIARIRKAGFDKLDERYVVDLNISIDGVHRHGEFTLSEREHMNYPVLVGRNLIVEFGLVDARRSYIADEKIEL